MKKLLACAFALGIMIASIGVADDGWSQSAQDCWAERQQYEKDHPGQSGAPEHRICLKKYTDNLGLRDSSGRYDFKRLIECLQWVKDNKGDDILLYQQYCGAN
jgi:hypothetical protein